MSRFTISSISNFVTNIVIILLTFSVFSCSSIKESAEQQTLYQALGQQQGIERLVNIFIKKLGQDKQIFPYFAKASVSHFRQGFISHICEASDGPCQYEGDNMVDIHTGMNINEADFNRVVELLVLAMEEAGIDYPIQNKVLAKFAPLRGEIIKI
ncbi:group I truncated hemoglobin [Thalassotalea profundi]|uniref:Group 1 truncated hemoglobin n=1 Tax=Thalassotalea profundi TaxID=2036687 RepID=A0ABQ3IRI0_9GAMM|nr:group 1 truncated hemoglobin [Thalassotalea profundi]GHE91813.1 group 1 truncated hemoglobin [Thalassotalea profundi]